MNNELIAILGYIEQERGISRESLIRALESAILTASRKSIHPANELKVRIDPVTGDIRAWAMLEVVEENPTCDQLVIERARERFPDAKLGDVLEWEVTPRNFGRIAAQTAKQAIIQQLRKAEKENVQEEYADQVGHILNGTVRRFDAGSIIIDFGKAEGIINAKEKVHGEQYMPGDRINALLVRVDINTAGPSLIVSRSCPEFVEKLFEREVSEIHDGVVEIAGIAREAGMRTKIAVRSNDPRIDPVGACVGMRGMRVRNITSELGNERVDIIRYEDDIKVYAANALHPAKLESISVDENRRMLTIRVNSENSRLAFGKKAQNVRLAQKLIGWNINFVTDDAVKEDSFEEKKMQYISQLSSELSISPAKAEILVNNGYLTVEGLRSAGISDIAAIKGMDEETVNAISEGLAKINQTSDGASDGEQQ